MTTHTHAEPMWNGQLLDVHDASLLSSGDLSHWWKFTVDELFC